MVHRTLQFFITMVYPSLLGCLLGNEFHYIVSSQLLVHNFLVEIAGRLIVLRLNVTRAALHHPNLQPEVFRQPFEKR